MKQNEIEKRLKQYAASCREILPEERESRIAGIIKAYQMLRTKGSLWNFIWEQAGYLEKYCLIWQGLWLAAFGYLIKRSENKILMMVSLLPPVLVLATIEEITKVYQKTMLEIEYATKYSLRSVVMVRLSVLSVFNAAFLTVGITFWQMHSGSGIFKLLVYGFTPMILMTGLLFWLMQYCQGELLRNAAAALYAVIVMLIFLGNTEWFGWYQTDRFGAWCAAGIAGTAFGVWQFARLGNKLVSYERITQ